MKQPLTVLRDERVIGGAERDEPIPMRADLEQHGRPVQRRGDRRRARPVHRVHLPDDVDVPELPPRGLPLHGLRERLPLVVGRPGVEVQQVAVARVVDGAEEAERAAGVVARAGDPVREGRRASGTPVQPRRRRGRGRGGPGGRGPREERARGGAEEEEGERRRGEDSRREARVRPPRGAHRRLLGRLRRRYSRGGGGMPRVLWRGWKRRRRKRESEAV